MKRGVNNWIFVDDDLDGGRRIVDIILVDNAFSVGSKVDGRIREKVSAENAVVVFFDV